MVRRILSCSFVLGLASVLSTATLQAADSQPKEFIELILKLIGDEDKEFRAAGLEQVRDAVHGSAFTQLFAAQLPKLGAGGQVALLDALADRGDGAARSAVRDLFASSRDENVRTAAIGALGRLGAPDDVPLLVKTLSGRSRTEQAAARQSLARISGGTINGVLAAESQSASPTAKAALLEVLAARRAADQLPVFVAASIDENAHVRRAAMRALGEMGRPEQITQMFSGVLKAQEGFERDDAEKNVARICNRIDNENQRGAALIAALNTVDVARRDQLLSLVGRVGGKKLIDFVAEIAAGANISRRHLGIVALSKWPDASVADKLLDIANRATDPAERQLAFRGYVKVSAARDNRSDKERLDRLKQAMKAAKSPEEVALVINRVRTAYDVESVRFVLPYVDQQQFSQIACETIVEIAHHREVRDPHKLEFDKALDRVIAISTDPVVVERANRYKRGETFERRANRSRR